MKNGFEKAHELHSQKCVCNLPLNKHTKNCSVLNTFTDFIRDYKDPDMIKPTKAGNNP